MCSVGNLIILDHILKFSNKRQVLKEYQLMLIFTRGKKITVINFLHKEIGVGIFHILKFISMVQ